MQGQNLKELVESLGPEKFYRKACDLLNEKTLTADDFSYYELAEACGVLPRLRSVRESMTGEQSAAALLREANPGVSTHLFQVMTGELIGRKVLDGYENSDGFIGDELVTVLPSSLRGQKLAGFRALAGPTDVAEGWARSIRMSCGRNRRTMNAGNCRKRCRVALAVRITRR